MKKVNLNNKSQVETLAVVNDLHNSEVVGNQDKAIDLIGAMRKIGKETEPVTKVMNIDGMTLNEAIHEIALEFVKTTAMPSSDTKILITEFIRVNIPDKLDESLVSFVSDTVDSAYQQYPKAKIISGCTSLKYTLQDRRIVEIIGVSPEQEKKIEELLFSKEYLGLSKN